MKKTNGKKVNVQTPKEEGSQRTRRPKWSLPLPESKVHNVKLTLAEVLAVQTAAFEVRAAEERARFDFEMAAQKHKHLSNVLKRYFGLSETDEMEIDSTGRMTVVPGTFAKVATESQEEEGSLHE
jgi:hypothetical protein